MKTLGLTALVSFSIGALPLPGLVASAHAGEGKVLIIDAGADLAHQKLKGFVGTNAKEASGKKGVDDDGDGFVDDVGGWNAVSDDGVYMPDYVLQMFTKNPTVVKKLLAMYSAMEAGDETVVDQVRANPQIMQAIAMLLDVAHGTHVAGIIAMNSAKSSRIQSMNVFNGSKPEAEEDDGLHFHHHSVFGGALAKLVFDKDLRTRPFDIEDEGSFLDDSAAITKILAEVEKENQTQFDILNRYIKGSGAGVINLSMGTSIVAIQSHLLELYQRELLQNGLDPETPMTTTQRANFARFVNGIYDSTDKEWNELFKQNSNVLFVVAAGNDGDADDVTAGDISKHKVTPATASVTHDNVITVVATDKKGVMADFSCYSKQYANIGAWGTAVPSLAPGNNMVTMSGTSMSAPFVTGVASHIRGLNEKLTAAEVRKIIEATGKKVGSLKDKTTSGAMIDPEAAYKAAQATGQGHTLIEVVHGADHDKALRPALDGSEGQVVHTSDLVKKMMKSYDLF